MRIKCHEHTSDILRTEDGNRYIQRCPRLYEFTSGKSEMDILTIFNLTISMGSVLRKHLEKS